MRKWKVLVPGGLAGIVAAAAMLATFGSGAEPASGFGASATASSPSFATFLVCPRPNALREALGVTHGTPLIALRWGAGTCID